MEHWQYLPVLAALVILPLAIWSAARKRKKRKERDFTRRLETVLQQKETLKVVCPQKTGHCALTSSRLLFENGEGFTAVPLTKIKRVQGFLKDGKSTTSPAKMASMTIKTDKEYTLYNTSPEFVEIAKALKNRKKTK